MMPPTPRTNASSSSSPYPPSRPNSAKPAISSNGNSNTANSSLILRKQLMELQKHPVDGFSAGLVDDDNMLEWDIVIMGPVDTLWEGAILKARLIFPPEYPLLPPKMIFDSEMWHPNIYNKGDKKGEVCVSILHQPGEDEWGFEDAGERWLPVHTVESVLISVISLLSQDVPDLSSPANVDAAKEVREDYPSYKKKVKRLARRSAEEAYD
ncbi:ubiquitin-conjugating enzyme E2 G1 [Cryptococcus neoformans]|uniref:E2 ubiquitin-conjugating enzyme n=2 Tax=Cryptococcus neoformans TaxID=5207 RepID=A0A854QF28_CRYNE|nr:ubiquitin-conjugating enzyme E2 G1 [Cryptococcus neoformans var. grubii H99]AUB25735.1 ubiquitin-conjugating enzyme E2 G1 [Cryptococcus neoformans var. grubii]OWT38838.1 ubiquitin-conjugating enzyme E2 G1 [Cryptococcus neoformans var. grubii Bt1]OWZ30892.1 ubiquitin-conjugating enzyme E2 G1 [Cryptococcus neoformans var. grubii AD2-60a]OWZ40055.1 ubiquitin-conjugating enzyme E2 G1 [Cryptococcus neoformans var. grubii AD1-83a]OWZ41805.1 ubiquitin-conjugating enzyme E2 G1 [Cryptococcus neoform|eukprot:XP_012050284.1 ubiquitin-conjugating enzyme E2 G1 [Cryptococcus neoformans var. grubii H99]